MLSVLFRFTNSDYPFWYLQTLLDRLFISIGAEKLQKLNIRIHSSNVRPIPAKGINEIPLWEKEYEHYDEKQLALECKRLETEIKGTLERRRKVDESLNAKKDLHT